MGAFNGFIVANASKIIKVTSLLEKHFASFVFFAIWNVELIGKIEGVIVRSVVFIVVAFVHEMQLWYVGM